VLSQMCQAEVRYWSMGEGGGEVQGKCGGVGEQSLRSCRGEVQAERVWDRARRWREKAILEIGWPDGSLMAVSWAR